MTSDFGEPADPAKAQQQEAQTAAEALARWHATHADTWLVAAISNTDPGNPAAAELIQAAAADPERLTGMDCRYL